MANAGGLGFSNFWVQQKISFGENFVNNLELGSEVKIVVLAQVHYLKLQWIDINELDICILLLLCCRLLLSCQWNIKN